MTTPRATEDPPAAPAPPAPEVATAYNLDLVAALVCMKLRKTDPAIGLGLIDRYRAAVDQAIAEYGPDAPGGQHPGFGNRYLMEVVVEALGREAHVVYGDPRVEYDELPERVAA